MGTDERPKGLTELYQKLRWWSDKETTKPFTEQYVKAKRNQVLAEIKEIEEKENT